MATARTWVQIRREDVIREAALWVVCAQLVVGTIAVYYSASTARAQSQEVINERLISGQAVLSSKVAAMESLGIDGRLKLLERDSEDAKETAKELRQLAYGILLTLFGLVATNIMSIRESRKRRAEGATA